MAAKRKKARKASKLSGKALAIEVSAIRDQIKHGPGGAGCKAAFYNLFRVAHSKSRSVDELFYRFSDACVK